MTCQLCAEQIGHYQPRFHRLTLTDGTTVAICPSCIEAFSMWQLRNYSQLFPSKATKRWFDTRRRNNG